jgi:predicted DCC family thiol-disulfide oxidoreductase YuxK
MATRALPLLVFDGDCSFCTSAARWAERGWHGKAEALPWQHLGVDGLKRVGLTEDQAREAAWWVDREGVSFRGHLAIGKALSCSDDRARRKAGSLVMAPVASRVASAVYDLVVKYRHLLPGATPACSVSRPATGAR